MAITMNGAYFNGLDGAGLDTALFNVDFPVSVTTDFILISLNVASGSNADINYGWYGGVLATGGKITPYCEERLCRVVKAGVAQRYCRRVWLTVGSSVTWDPSTRTFTNIQKILGQGGQLGRTLMDNFAAIRDAVDIPGLESVGFDMDYEEGDDLALPVSNVTIALQKRFEKDKRPCPITFCPYDRREQWIDALQKVHAELKTQPVVGFNLQTYAGGWRNVPSDWTDAIALAPDIGVSDPANFIWPIVSCTSEAAPLSLPGDVTRNLKRWGSKGGSLWSTSYLSPDASGLHLSDYSTAIYYGIR